jgi:hypothetical protein
MFLSKKSDELHIKTNFFHRTVILEIIQCLYSKVVNFFSKITK